MHPGPASASLCVGRPDGFIIQCGQMVLRQDLRLKSQQLGTLLHWAHGTWLPPCPFNNPLLFLLDEIQGVLSLALFCDCVLMTSPSYLGVPHPLVLSSVPRKILS